MGHKTERQQFWKDFWNHLTIDCYLLKVIILYQVLLGVLQTILSINPAIKKSMFCSFISNYSQFSDQTNDIGKDRQIEKKTFEND